MAIRPKTKMAATDDNGPLARYVKLLVAHALGMLGTFSPPPWISDPGMHHGTLGIFPAHAQPAILHICQAAHGNITSF